MNKINTMNNINSIININVLKNKNINTINGFCSNKQHKYCCIRSIFVCGSCGNLVCNNCSNNSKNECKICVSNFILLSHLNLECEGCHKNFMLELCEKCDKLVRICSFYCSENEFNVLMSLFYCIKCAKKN